MCAATGQHICYLMELPERDNLPNISRIPAGRYLVKYLARSGSGKYHDVYHITGVPDRSGILIHGGNFAGDTELNYRTDSWGCVLTARRIGAIGGQVAGLASRAALRKLHKFTNKQDFYLEVI
ncbi:hypothetical protein AVO42_00390 [Thiomicrospira sp. XS5]|nr:hypothetical protein AVO42_00390 [Thiomicrospira sp. XS5]